MGGTAPAHRSAGHGTKSWNVGKKGSCKAVATVVGLMLLVLGILDLESGFVRGLSYGIRLAVLSERERALSSSDPIFSSPDLPNCLARTQHLLYRKQALRFPTPPRILDLFHRYSEMHRCCTVGKRWEDEIVWKDEQQSRLDRRLLQDQDSGQQLGEQESGGGSQCQYLFLQMRSGSGLGNRILSILSGFLYALLTNRAIVTDPEEHVWHLFCEPFEGSSWFLPKGFPITTMAPNISIELKDASSQNFTKDAIVTVQLFQDLGPSEKRFWCAATQEQLKDVKWIVWASNQYSVPRFFSTPYFWPLLKTIFPADVDPSKIFLHLSRHLILPQNFLWDRIVRIYWSEMADARKRVGVQRRHGVKNKAFSRDVYNRVMTCAIDAHVLPNTTLVEIEEPETAKSNPISESTQFLSDQLRRFHLQSATTSRWQFTGRRRKDGELKEVLALVDPAQTLASNLLGGESTSVSSRSAPTGEPETKAVKEDHSAGAQNLTADSIPDGRPIVVLFANLRPDYWEEMKAHYTIFPTDDGSVVRAIQVTHDTNQKQSFSQMSDALVEMWLLSFSDELMLSSWSTFGYISLGLSGLNHPYIMNIRGEKLRADVPACVRWQTSDPCNHFSFLEKGHCTLGNDNSTLEARMGEEQQAWFHQHIRSCERAAGIQIIPVSTGG